MSPLLVAIALVVGLGLLAFAVYTFVRSRLGRPAPGAEVLRARICDLKPGGVVRLGGFGDDKEDVVLTVTSFAHGRMGTDEWHDLAGDYRGRTLALEWRDKGPGGLLRVTAFRKTAIPLAEAGLDLATLEGLRAGGNVTAFGTSFRVEEVGDAIRTFGRESLAVRCWWLVDDDKRQVLRVERVGQQEPVAAVGVHIAADGAEIVSLGK